MKESHSHPEAFLNPYVEAALTPLIFLLEYWNQMPAEERFKWYDAKDDLLTEAGKELLKKEEGRIA